MNYDFSVVVLSYHPDREKLLSTLRSVVMQKGVSLEIIVADDGSSEFFEENIREMLEGVVDYQIIAHEQNQGTVKNLLDVMQVAQGRYIKPVSPGDYLYDENTLKAAADFMDTHEACAMFGDMAYYVWDGQLQLFDRKTPYDDAMYLPGKAFSCRRSAKYQMVYNENISGAAVFLKRDIMLWGLETICPAVCYAEDTMLQIFVLAGKRIYKMPRFVMWYEFGSGISTNSSLEFSSRLTQDFCRFYELLQCTMPNKPYVKRTCATWRMLQKGGIGNTVRKCLEFDKHIFRLRKRKLVAQFRLGPVDEESFRRIIRA